MTKCLYRKRRRKDANVWAGRLAWLGHLLDVQKVAGPNPARPTLLFLLLQLARIH